MNPSKFALLLISLATISISPNAATSAADGAGEFLNLGFGVQSLGIGNSGRAVAGGAEAVYWNPANLSSLTELQGLAAHASQFDDFVTLDNIGVAFPDESGESGIGVGLIRLAVDDIPRTQDLLWLDHGADGIPDTGDAGENNGDWDPGERVIYDESRLRHSSDSQWAAQIAYGTRITDHAALGVATKILRQNIAETKSWGVGIDLAATYHASPRLTFAANLLDVGGTRIVWDTGRRERVPMRAVLSQAFTPISFHSVSIELTGDLTSSLRRSENVDAKYGAQLRYYDVVSARIGSFGGEWTAGAGIRVRRLVADYAYMSHQALGASHRVGIAYRNGGSQR